MLLSVIIIKWHNQAWRSKSTGHLLSCLPAASVRYYSILFYFTILHSVPLEHCNRLLPRPHLRSVIAIPNENNNNHSTKISWPVEICSGATAAAAAAKRVWRSGAGFGDFLPSRYLKFLVASLLCPVGASEWHKLAGRRAIACWLYGFSMCPLSLSASLPLRLFKLLNICTLLGLHCSVVTWLIVLLAKAHTCCLPASITTIAVVVYCALWVCSGSGWWPAKWPVNQLNDSSSEMDWSFCPRLRRNAFARISARDPSSASHLDPSLFLASKVSSCSTLEKATTTCWLQRKFWLAQKKWTWVFVALRRRRASWQLTRQGHQLTHCPALLLAELLSSVQLVSASEASEVTWLNYSLSISSCCSFVVAVVFLTLTFYLAPVELTQAAECQALGCAT